MGLGTASLGEVAFPFWEQHLQSVAVSPAMALHESLDRLCYTCSLIGACRMYHKGKGHCTRTHQTMVSSQSRCSTQIGLHSMIIERMENSCHARRGLYSLTISTYLLFPSLAAVACLGCPLSLIRVNLRASHASIIYRDVCILVTLIALNDLRLDSAIDGSFAIGLIEDDVGPKPSTRVFGVHPRQVRMCPIGIKSNAVLQGLTNSHPSTGQTPQRTIPRRVRVIRSI